MSIPITESITVIDTTLRDGLQIEDRVVPTALKVEIARALVDAGFRHLEIGSFVNPKKVPQMADTAELYRELGSLEDEGVTLYSLVFNAKGAQRAVDAGALQVKLVISASEGHSRSNSDSSIAQAGDRLLAAIQVLKANNVAFEVGTAVSFICPIDGPTPPQNLVSILEPLVAEGAAGVGVADTIGNANPRMVRTGTKAVQQAFPDMPITVHLHDTYNFGIANVVTTLEMGITRFDATLGGLGGCPFAPGAAGNIGSDDLIHLLHREGYSTGIDTEKLAGIRPTLTRAIGHPLSSKLSTIPAVPEPAPIGRASR
ncbi:hydroxymethylglutaryl-CoA lyase [Saxibacter everestensis]|uniref:Hydroxymethylglutaryl-CoA lyase n=1 Tax=Saxibacter everestensis TaxID=2909229 RepID=A0ABY8QT58_9MICO|nr:hydroxymethylglutaryl-CoA lyase [Brevibacteriaceae bacterium ZFBP1038]